MKILLIEDDRMIGASLVRGLRDEGYVVNWVRDGVSATTALADTDAGYSLALIDWGLPRQDGLHVLRGLRAAGDPLPVLMITARDTLDDRVIGLDSGADDYLVKPFALAELMARIRSLLRRRAGRTENELLHGALKLNPLTHTTHLRGALVNLSAREFKLMHALLVRPGAVLSRRQLEARLYTWSEAVDSNVIEVVIHCVRRKLGAEIIDNVRGVGWRIGAPP